MDALIISPTSKTLSVTCENGMIELKGCSIANDPRSFFNPIMNWVKEYIKRPEESTEIICKFDYIDTASFKHLFTILQELEGINKNNTKVIVKWYYYYEDPEILELGEILQGRLDLNFELISQ